MNILSRPITQDDLNSLAAARGEDKPNVAWILTPFDTYEKNPFYTGPRNPYPMHPEIAYEMEQERKQMVAFERSCAKQSGSEQRDF